MYRSDRTRAFGLVILGLLVCVILVGCSGKIKGTERENSAPSISFANVPPESTTFSITPTVYWNATDVDGYISKYQYAVIVRSYLDGQWGSVASALTALTRIPVRMWIDSLTHLDSLAASISAKETISSIEKVQLFAGQSQTDTISQYLFVRAVDNENETSALIYRMFSRNNHKPKSHINYSSFYTGAVVTTLYSLPDTTDTWKGIKITWEGSDSDDYKGTQPNFLYKWELYGPFADSIALDTAVLSDSASHGRLVAASFNESDSTRFVEDKSLLLPTDQTYLVNYPHTVTSPPSYPYSGPDNGYGWYLFVVWTLDDAFSLSKPFGQNADSVGHLWFKVTQPLFSYQSQRKVLILDFTWYNNQGGEISMDSLRSFYNGAFAHLVDAGIVDEFAIIDTSGAKKTPYLTADSLSRFNLVIYLNEARSRDCSKLVPIVLAYLKVGGKAWAIGNGVATFGLDLNQGYYDFRSNPASCELPLNFFGLNQLYVESWSTFSRTEQFVGARAEFGTLDLPDLKMDSARVANQLNWGSVPPDSVKMRAPRTPLVGHAILRNGDDRIYSFLSHPDTALLSSLHLKPSGTVYEYPGGICKTAYLDFPLHLMQRGPNLTTTTRDSLFEAIVGDWFEFQR